MGVKPIHKQIAAKRRWQPDLDRNKEADQAVDGTSRQRHWTWSAQEEMNKYRDLP